MRDCVTPSARLASRMSRGTSRSISSVARTISGTMTSARANAPAKPEKPNSTTQSAYTNAPVTIVGMPSMTSVTRRSTAAMRPVAYWLR